MPTIRTYAVSDSGRIVRRDDHAGAWVDVSPPSSINTKWKDVMSDPTNPDKVVAVGAVLPGRGIVVSSDAGVTWTLPVGDWTTATQFYEVWFVDNNTIWAVAANGIVVRSVNGGLSFNRVSDIPNQANHPYTAAIHALDDYVVVVGASSLVLDETYVYKSIDGGISWQIQNGGLSLPDSGGIDSKVGVIDGIWISQDQNRILASAHYIQSLSIDGGTTFNSDPPEFTRSGEHLTWFPSHSANPPTFYHVGGFSNMVAKSTDNGTTFMMTRVYDGSNQLTILGAHFYSASEGYYLINNLIYSTTDGAETGILSYTEEGESTFTAVWTGTPIPDCECTRFRWDTASCGISLTSTGEIALSSSFSNNSTENGKSLFVFTFESNSYKIYWSTINNRWELLWINSGNLLLAFLAEDTQCPVGTWTIAPGYPFMTSLVTTTRSKIGIAVDCNDEVIQFNVPFDHNEDSTAGNWTEPLCIKGYSITNQGLLSIEVDVAGLCVETEEGPICPVGYKLIDCTDSSNEMCVSNNLSAQFNAGTIINIQGSTRCWRIEEDFDCIGSDTLIVITASFANCEDCLPDQPVLGIACPVVVRVGEPGFNTKNCDPDEVISIKCTYADSVYALFKRLRYGIETCCEFDLDKADIKNMLVDLGELYDPDLCEDIIPAPTECCGTPTNVLVILTTPIIIACAAPTNPILDIVMPPPACPDPVGPVITDLETP